MLEHVEVLLYHFAFVVREIEQVVDDPVDLCFEFRNTGVFHRQPDL